MKILRKTSSDRDPTKSEFALLVHFLQADARAVRSAKFNRHIHQFLEHDVWRLSKNFGKDLQRFETPVGTVATIRSAKELTIRKEIVKLHSWVRLDRNSSQSFIPGEVASLSSALLRECFSLSFATRQPGRRANIPTDAHRDAHPPL
jgi:hypothetical protein